MAATASQTVAARAHAARTMEPFAFTWGSQAARVLACHHLRADRPIVIHALETDDGELVVDVRAPAMRSEWDFWHKPECRIVLSLRVTGDPRCTVDGVKARWNCAAEGPLDSGRFSAFTDYVRNAFAEDAGGHHSVAMDQLCHALEQACGLVARRAVALCDAQARAVALRFEDSVRFFAYRQIVRDSSGRIIQVAEACPGLLILMSLLGDNAAEAVAEDVRAGAKLRDILTRVLDTSCKSQWGPVAQKKILLALLRKAPSNLDPYFLTVPVPAGLSLSDIPHQLEERQLWYRAVCALAQVDRYGKVSRLLRRPLGPFFSRYGSQLARAAHDQGLPMNRFVSEIVDYLEHGTFSVPCRRTPVARFLAELRAWHLACWSGDWHGINDLVFPAPPCVGHALDGLDVRPICTPADLIAEGSRMQHCVATRAVAIAQGLLAVYHVGFHAESLTLALRATPPGEWSIDEVSGFANRSPSGAAVVAIRRWLAALNQAMRDSVS